MLPIFIAYVLIYNHYDFLLDKYNKFKTLISFTSTSTQCNNPIITYYKSFSVLGKSLYVSFLQYMNNSVKCIGNNYYEVSYTINNKLYKMIVKHKRGPNPIHRVTDNNNNDLTNIVIQYLGPNQDWHKNIITPHMLNTDEIEIELSNSVKKKFSSNEILYLNF